MAKFNTVVMTTKDGTEVRFVTRGRAKAISKEEMQEYCVANGLAVSFTDEEEADWAPANKKVFLIDLKFGLEFCSSKYGVSHDTILNHVRAIAPHLNTNVYIGGQKDG